MRISDTLLAMAKELENPNNKAILESEGFPWCLDRVAVAVVSAAEILKQCAEEVDLMQGKRTLLVAEAKQLLQALAATPLDKAPLTVTLFDGQEKLGEMTAPTLQMLQQLDAIEVPADVMATVALADNEQVSGEAVEKLARMAHVFDASQDASLRKQASVLDELLLTIAVPAEWKKDFEKRQAKQLEELKKVYQDTHDDIQKSYGAEDMKKAIEKSEYMKENPILSEPLSTRYCPDHAGAPISRVGENQWQCSLDHRVYDYVAGFKDDKGYTHHPGGAPAVAQMTKLRHDYHSIFDSRDDRLNKMK